MNINNEYILNIVYSGQYEYSLVGKPMAKGKGQFVYLSQHWHTF